MKFPTFLVIDLVCVISVRCKNTNSSSDYIAIFMVSFLVSHSLKSVFHLIPPISQERDLHKAFSLDENLNEATTYSLRRSDISQSYLCEFQVIFRKTHRYTVIKNFETLQSIKICWHNAHILKFIQFIHRKGSCLFP